MASSIQTENTKKILKDLMEDIRQLTLVDSNVEVIWGLERLHIDNALMMSADFIRKEIKQQSESND